MSTLSKVPGKVACPDLVKIREIGENPLCVVECMLLVGIPY